MGDCSRFPRPAVPSKHHRQGTSLRAPPLFKHVKLCWSQSVPRAPQTAPFARQYFSMRRTLRSVQQGCPSFFRAGHVRGYEYLELPYDLGSFFQKTRRLVDSPLRRATCPASRAPCINSWTAIPRSPPNSTLWPNCVPGMSTGSQPTCAVKFGCLPLNPMSTAIGGR